MCSQVYKFKKFITISFCFTDLHNVYSQVYLQQKNYWRSYKLAVWLELLNHTKKVQRSATLRDQQHSVTGSPAQPTTYNNTLIKTIYSEMRSSHVISMLCCNG